jgi:hypothetical protein
MTALVLLAVARPSGAQVPDPPRRILFVGNSYTCTNDLPSMVRSLADSAGVHMTIEAVTAPGVSLEDHWIEGTARRRIAEGQWDLVIMQQGPSSRPEGRAILGEYVARFNRVIRHAGAHPALYMVWPSRDRRGDFDGARDSYVAAARTVGGLSFRPARPGAPRGGKTPASSCTRAMTSIPACSGAT